MKICSKARVLARSAKNCMLKPAIMSPKPMENGSAGRVRRVIAKMANVAINPTRIELKVARVV